MQQIDLIKLNPIGKVRIVLLGFIFSLVSLFTFSRSVDDIQLFHHKVIVSFFDMQKEGKALNREVLQQLFKVVNLATITLVDPKVEKKNSKHEYLKQLNRDIANLKKIINQKLKRKENVDLELRLSADLCQLQKVLKKYRLQIEVVECHAAIRTGWGDLFDAVDQSQDILPLLPLKGIEQSGLKGLKIFVKKMERLLRDVDGYEDRLHADWVDLKLANYVFKIELIRLRNAAIFHPLYRGRSIQTSYPR